jgi:pimeloyl-ACP methyl ester carboxylesterase
MSASAFQPLPVEPSFFAWRGHQIASYEAGAGPPVLLIHSINAAASAFEMRGPFAGLQDAFRVQAIDLLGFGRSDRPARRYTPDDYIDLIGDTLRQRGEPTALIASTLGAAYAVAAATRWPALVRALVLVCPTGIELLADPPGSLAAVGYAVLRGPVGAAIYKGLATPPSVRYFLEQQTYADPKNVTPETFEGFYRATQHPGAMYAPICFVSGLLNYNISEEFARLTQPLLIVWGRQAKITKLKQADAFMQRNPRARLEVFDNCGMIVQDECSAAFNQLAAAFLRETSNGSA